MKENNNKWKTLSLPFNKNYRDALQQQHHAAQFIALAGRHLIPQQPDDSNTNMQYIPEKEILTGNELSNGLRTGLNLYTLELCLLDNKLNQLKKITLPGKTRQQGFEELILMLSNSGVDVSNLKDELHYSIPEHPVSKGAAFSIKDAIFFKENALSFNNSKIVLESIIKNHKDAAPVRVWPHHFDTGTFFPISHNISGEMTRSIGLGMAIPDTMVNEPYFYLSFWSADSTENINTVEAPEFGEWKTPDWKGAVLQLSKLLDKNSSDAQFETVLSFFRSGINILIKQFN